MDHMDLWLAEGSWKVWEEPRDSNQDLTFTLQTLRNWLFFHFLIDKLNHKFTSLDGPEALQHTSQSHMYTP